MTERSGLVSLVGAGPGDPGLLTLKGAERMREADVVVFDRLASPDLLALAPEGAELIDVGKGPGNPGLGQEAIDDLIVEKALAGARVVRLKGGDPFVFGRGGEEAAACSNARVRFEVVPGVTSAIAAPAYAGIPVTHRGISTSVTFVTGHEDPAKEDDQVDWASLAALNGTLVLMMSVGSLSEICDRLQEAGRPGSTPVAAIEWGTHPRQRVVEATLETMAERASAESLKAPAAVVVGDVVSLRDKISWFDRRPLWGRRILVTRARDQASRLARRLCEEGAEVVVHPLIAIEPPEDPAALDDAVDRVAGGGFSWVIFASANGVAHFFDAIRRSTRDARVFAGTRVAAIGGATSAALEERGVCADLVPEAATSEGMVEALPLNVKGEEILLVRAAEGSLVMADGLASRSFDITEVIAYKNVVPREMDADTGAGGGAGAGAGGRAGGGAGGGAAGGAGGGAGGGAAGGAGETTLIRSQLAAGEIDAVAFASSSTVTNFVRAFGVEAVPPVVACIGPATAATASEFGINPSMVAEEQSIDGLAAALVEAFSRDGELGPGA